ncbi:MAG: PAS domain S-box protein [Gemmatimonadota bacterium]|nr:PAS domain S-box protein [Gemmatimonadota bacterium]
MTHRANRVRPAPPPSSNERPATGTSALTDTAARLRGLEAALATMQLGVTVTDVAGTIVYVNAADARMHGYAPEELIGQSVGVFSCPDDRQPLGLEAMRRLASWRRESFNRRKDGTVFPVELLSDAVLGADGDPVGVVTTCQDITARKLAEQTLSASHNELHRALVERTHELAAANQQLQQEVTQRVLAERQRHGLERQLQQAQKIEALGQLTGGIAHDFNNVLSVIMANGDLLADAGAAGSEAQAAALEDIRTAARHGARIVAQLLGFARRAELTLVPTDLRTTIADTAGMLTHVIREDIVIRTSLGAAVGTVALDHAAFQQMLLNLATNARDAMPDGGTIHVEVSTQDLDDAYGESHPWVAPGAHVCVAVSDTGVGMDADTVSRIFEPFFTTKPPGQGTGLGMAMIYGLMKQHRGFVHVYSERGVGTTVRLYFPTVAQAAQAAPAPATARQLRTGSETILVAEDEAALRSTARRVLERFGYTVLTASNGAEALSIYHANRAAVRLIITDLVMPKLGGRALYEAVRREDDAVRFIFASGYSAADARERETLDPRVPFLRKPWTLNDLAQQVREALDAD